MKKTIITLLSIMLCFTLTACGEKKQNELSGNSYVGVSPENFFTSFVIYFHDDDVVQVVEYTRGGGKVKTKSHLGTYDKDNSALTIKIVDKDYLGIFSNGNGSITFGDNEYTLCEYENLSDETKKEIEKILK